MKVSLNWVKQFTDIDISVDELVKKIGEQLGAVEEVEYLGDVYKDVVIAKVVSCEKHPNADKLSVCAIDDGGVVEGVERNEQGYVQVVCGAPNVREGLFVAWLPPGATVPSTAQTDPFVLEARELRGIVSNGMLASAKELAIGDEHEGILEVDVAAEPGRKFADVYQLDDYIVTIENKMFTHRPDCFGILGVAREIAGIQQKQFRSPEWYMTPLDRIKPGAEKLPLRVDNQLPELAPRFLAIAVKDVEVKKSPVIIRSFLSRVGIKPINNLVDITNYLMVLTGQPLHAYDYDKVAERSQGDGAVLQVRFPQKGEKISLLNGKEIEPRDKAIMIATDKELIGVGGVMGGSDTEVTDATKNIILECANFDMYSIRRTSMAHGLFTDAVTRFNKGQSPLQNDTVLEEAVALTLNLAGGTVASEVVDTHDALRRPESLEVNAKFVSSRLGSEVSAAQIATLLDNVEFQTSYENDSVSLTPPFWRTDIEIVEDVIEEVGRLLGFDALPVTLPKRSIQPVPKNSLLELKSQLRNALSSAGANELLTYSFVHGDLLEKVGQDKTKAFKLSNALSPDLQYYRLSVLPNLLEKVHPNSKAGHAQFALYELGKVHYKGEMDEEEPSVPNEDNHLACVVVTQDKNPAYYHAKTYLQAVAPHVISELQPMTSFDFSSDEWGAQLTALYEPTRSAVIVREGQIWGVIGEFKSSVRKALKLPEATAGFEVHLDNFKGQVTQGYTQLSKYPSVQQDISLKVSKELAYGELESFLKDSLDAPKNTTHTLEPLDIYEKGAQKHITFRLTIASYDKTLKSEEVNALLDTLASKAADKFNAERL